MSFDVYLQKFKAGDVAQADREPVLAVLKSVSYSGPDAHNYYVIKFPDGTEVEFHAVGLDGSEEFTGCSFDIRGISDQLVAFIFEIAKAGDMVIMPATDPLIPILTLPSQRDELSEDLTDNEPEPVLCESPKELSVLLCGGFDEWKKYRDQVKRGSGSS